MATHAGAHFYVPDWWRLWQSRPYAYDCVHEQRYIKHYLKQKEEIQFFVITKKKHIGFYVQINSETDARQRVIEYALVMARPMVLYQADHPVHWSPVFLGGRLTQLGTDSENRRRLVTTVSTPVYDRRNHSQRVANLLGVVGTDVPIEDIKKMVPQYKVSRFDHNEF